jgi:hypothetical protein
MAVTLGRFINRLCTREALSPVDPGTVLPPDAFGTIIAMSGNVRNAALVSRQWNAQIREPYTYPNILDEYFASPQLRLCMQGTQGSCRERVLQTIGHFQRRLRAIDPRAAELLNDKRFPIDCASLEELEKSACLIKVFDRVLDCIPPAFRFVLPADYQEKAPFIRRWLNDPANHAAIMSITNLDLSNSSLTGLPTEIGNLTSLTHLYLGNNQLTELPESFARLKALTFLDLSFNQLTELPESFGDLAALGSLNLAYNQLARLPESFGRLATLGYLYLAYNQLTRLPESFGDLAAMTAFDVRNNQLTKLPDSMNRLAGLERLDLRNNPITDLSNINEHLREILIT